MNYNTYVCAYQAKPTKQPRLYLTPNTLALPLVRNWFVAFVSLHISRPIVVSITRPGKASSGVSTACFVLLKTVGSGQKLISWI